MPMLASGIAAGVSAIAGPISAAIGSEASKGDRIRAQEAMDRAMNEIMSVGAPPELAREILLKEFKQVGVLSPQLEQAIELGVSEASQIQEDPALRQTQMEALEKMKETGRIGIGPVERAALNKIKQETAKENQAKQAQILQGMAQRGMAGSGAELAASLQAAQAGSDQMAESGDALAAQAFQRMLDAVSSGEKIASGVRGQDFTVAKSKADAADAVKRFNIENAIARQTRNVGASNRAQEMNLANQQSIANQNVAQANAELQRQRQAEAQQYALQAERARMRAGAYTGQANQSNQAAQNTMSGALAVGQGVAGAANAAAGAFAPKSAKAGSDVMDDVQKALISAVPSATKAVANSTQDDLNAQYNA